MQKFNLTFLFFILTFFAKGTDNATLLRNNAIRVEKSDQLSDSVYNLLSHYKLIMMGEMHGSNEPAKFVTGLAKLFTDKGDSVQVGLEIASQYMTKFITEQTDSSVYLSEFFAHPPYLDGRESFAWANILLKLNKNPKILFFFFDTNDGEGKSYERDSMMYLKIKKQIYGSQIVFNKSTGAQEFYPIEDEINVNKRRAQIGLQPIEEYAKNFGIDYKFPNE